MTVAFINGKRSRAPRRERLGNLLHYNPDIEWLLNQSRGELGERGLSIDPNGGSSGKSCADNWPTIERLHRACGAVAIWRRRNAVFSRLTPETRSLLRQRYLVTERAHSEVRGLVAAFSDLATLAWHLCEDKALMRDKLSAGSARSDKSVTSLRRIAERVNAEIHRAWLDAERDMIQASIE